MTDRAISSAGEARGVVGSEEVVIDGFGTPIR